ncbi:MAG: NAD-dependent epimerase/dehydratase family protein [Fimbriimonadaceae bacterium]|nr:NAD-dependent epimerase/dehydratase family protein [Fimbriimonadaceae bacterium]
MDVLVIGGTKFVGRALTDALLARGHRVTHFNRGQSGPDVFPQVETVLGDRKTDLHRLPDRTWDAVVDTCGYRAVDLQTSTSFLGSRVGRYLYVSTISVYSDDNPPFVVETDRLSGPDFGDGEITSETYGPMKVATEVVLREALGDLATIVRPGVIIGPHDHTWRFTYWPHRFREGGDVLVPDAAEKRVTSVDVRDLADFQVNLLEQSVTGVFNVDNADLTFGALVEAASAGTGGRPVHVSDAFLTENNVQDWTELPIYLRKKFPLADTSAARAAGLRTRPLAETVRDLMAWVDESGVPDSRPGLAPEREKELLAQWRARA